MVEMLAKRGPPSPPLPPLPFLILVHAVRFKRLFAVGSECITTRNPQDEEVTNQVSGRGHTRLVGGDTTRLVGGDTLG